MSIKALKTEYRPSVDCFAEFDLAEELSLVTPMYIHSLTSKRLLKRVSVDDSLCRYVFILFYI